MGSVCYVVILSGRLASLFDRLSLSREREKESSMSLETPPVRLRVGVVEGRAGDMRGEVLRT